MSKDWIRDGISKFFGSVNRMDYVMLLIIGCVSVFHIMSGDFAVLVGPLIITACLRVFGYKRVLRFLQPGVFQEENGKDDPSRAEAWSILHARRDSLILEWSKYETDLSLMIDYPIMTDYTDPEIRKVISAMQRIRKAEMTNRDWASIDPHTSAMQEAVDEFELSFRSAEKYARRYGQTKLDPREQRKLSTARSALNIILDGSAPSYEIEAAYKSLRSSLKGIIDVPDKAFMEIETLVRREIVAS